MHHAAWPSQHQQLCQCYIKFSLARYRSQCGHATLVLCIDIEQRPYDVQLSIPTRRSLQRGLHIFLFLHCSVAAALPLEPDFAGQQ
jgi:hypothetical protein